MPLTWLLSVIMHRHGNSAVFSLLPSWWAWHNSYNLFEDPGRIEKSDQNFIKNFENVSRIQEYRCNVCRESQLYNHLVLEYPLFLKKPCSDEQRNYFFSFLSPKVVIPHPIVEPDFALFLTSSMTDVTEWVTKDVTSSLRNISGDSNT